MSKNIFMRFTILAILTIVGLQSYAALVVTGGGGGTNICAAVATNTTILDTIKITEVSGGFGGAGVANPVITLRTPPGWKFIAPVPVLSSSTGDILGFLNNSNLLNDSTLQISIVTLGNGNSSDQLRAIGVRIQARTASAAPGYIFATSTANTTGITIGAAGTNFGNLSISNPDANVGVSTSICIGASTTIGAAAVGGNTYAWTSNPSGFVSASANPSVSPSITTRYILTQTITATGCSKTDSVLVTVNPFPAANVGSPSTICNGTSVSIGAAAVGGTTYAWTSNPAGFVSASANPSVSPSTTTRYILTQTITATGCSKIDSVLITVNPLPAANVGSPSSICIGASASIGAAAVGGTTYAWTSNPAGFVSASANPTVSPLTTTRYILTQTITATGCSKTDSVLITVNPLPAANIGSPSTICNGASASIGAAAVGGTTYSWTSNPSGFVSASSNPSVSPSTTTRYILTQTITATGCSKTDSVLITVNPSPAAIVGSAITLCNGLDTVIGSNAVVGNTYSWTSNPAGFTSSSANPRPMPSFTTTYYLTETITATGCSKTDSVKITVVPMPAAAVGLPTVICSGSSTNIGAAAVLGNTYSWTAIPAGFTSTSANPLITQTVNTIYFLTETITATGCSKSNNVSILVNPLPDANVGVAKTICMNNSTTIDAATVVGNTYSWTSNPAGFTSTSSNPSVSPSTTTKYYLTETITASGCIQVDSVIVTVNPLPAANVGAAQAICLNGNTNIGAAAVAGSTYNWSSNPAGFISTSANPNVAPLVTTTYYLIDTTTLTGCRNIDSVVVTVNPLPAANAGSAATICLNASTNIGAAAVVGNTYAWTSNPAGFTSTAANPSVSPTATTRYILTETITATGCMKMDSVLITVNPIPAALVGTMDSICPGGNKTIGAAAVSGNTYAWTSNPAGFTSTSSNPNVSPSVNTWYILTETITATGCNNTDSVLIKINPLPAAFVGSMDSICPGGNITIGSTAVSGNTYAWTSNPAGFTSTTANPNVSPSVNTWYILTETITATGCNKTDSFLIKINPLPTAFVGSMDSICPGGNITIGAAAVSGNTYSWISNPAGFTSTTANPNVSPSVNTWFILTETITATGCNKTDSVLIKINPIPAANAGTSGAICLNANRNIGATAVVGNTYAWTSNPAGFTSTSANPNVAPTVTTTYYLTETITATGCSKMDSVVVTVNPLPAANPGSASTICQLASANIGAAAVIGNTYAWTSNPAGFTSTSANPSVSPMTTTKYYITETITATGCMNMDSVIVTVNPIPAANPSASRGLCIGDSTNLGAATVIGNTYSWTSMPAGFTSTVSNPRVWPTVTTKYYITEVITATGCSNMDSVTITVNPLPAAITGIPQSVCVGNNVTIGAAAVPGNTYSWTSSPTGFTSTLANPTISQTVNTVYYLTETITATGCFKSNNVSILSNPLPAANVGLAKTICQNATTSIGANAVVGNTYSWTSSPAGFTSSAAKPSVSPLVTTKYYLTETITASGCIQVDSVIVTVNPIPAANVGAAQAICLNGNTNIGAAAVVGNTYNWSSNPTGFTSTSANPNVAPTTTTTYYLIDSITATGCRNIDSVVVTVNPLPAANAGSAATICLNASTNIGAAAVVGNTYSWTSNPAGFTSTAANPSVSPTATTRYILTETITATGCMKMDSVLITVNPIPAALVGTMDSICPGGNKTIGAAAVRKYLCLDF
ncbi:MAG: hypothetical protein IPK03_09085 [Bacteroidetes bacterium]|nr:hypothetical protein [Bacteroidota bacterium]